MDGTLTDLNLQGYIFVLKTSDNSPVVFIISIITYQTQLLEITTRVYTSLTPRILHEGKGKEERLSMAK